jgi:hypothetical protein
MPKHQGERTFFNPSNFHDFRMQNPFVLLVIFIRLAAAMSIIWYPFWGVLVSMLLDSFDWYVLRNFAKYSVTMYHILDKNLDWIAYCIEILYAFGSPWMPLLTVLLLYRLIGHILFLRTEKQRVLFVFGNYFDLAFLWLVGAPREGITTGMSSELYWSLFFVIILMKFLRELYLRVLMQKKPRV